MHGAKKASWLFAKVLIITLATFNEQDNEQCLVKDKVKCKRNNLALLIGEPPSVQGQWFG